VRPRLRKRTSAPASAAIALGLALAAAGAVTATPRVAHADRVRRDPRRTLPDYDNRPPPPPSAGEVAAWIPRVVFFPLYAVTEYVIRAPLGYVTTQLERAHVIDRLDRIMHPLPNLRITPSLVVDLGLVTSGGLHLTWTDAGARHNTVRLIGATGGAHFWRLGATDSYEFAPRGFAGISVQYTERADWRFYGLGSNTLRRDEQRFNWARTDIRFYVDWATLHHVGVSAASGVRYDRFGAPSVPLTLQTPVQGYDDHGTFYTEARMFADTRPMNRPGTTGARIEAAASAAQDTRLGTRQWVGGEVEGSVYVEVKHPGRVLSLRTYAAMVEPLGSMQVPFVDLVTLCGFESMQGFYWGRFRGESAALMTLSYRYPIWTYLDGMLFTEVGNTFGRHFEGFDVRRLYGSAGIGFRTTGDRDLSFHGLIAIGSSRFDEGFEIQSVRLAFGINRGF
jgi:hypothetical protein